MAGGGFPRGVLLKPQKSALEKRHTPRESQPMARGRCKGNDPQKPNSDIFRSNLPFA